MGSYKLTADAEIDLYRIWLYGLEHWGLAKVDAYTDAFFIRFEEIADYPLQYPAVDDVRLGYRTRPVSDGAENEASGVLLCMDA